jgi:hypothetical protein
MELLQRSMIRATGADVALASPLPRGALLPARTLTVGDYGAVLGRIGQQLTTTTMTGRQIRTLLERTASRFAPYDFESSRPLLLPGEADSLIDSFEGLTYEIDLTRPPGDRVIHLTHRGKLLDPESRLLVAVDDRRFSRGDLETPADPHRGIWFPEAWIDHLETDTFDGRWEQNWTILPDYAVTPQRSIIDRLVRHGGVQREDALRIFPEERARRGEMAYRLARAFGWRERRPSAAFPDVPDSLEPWVDGLLRRDVLGAAGREEFFQPFAPLTADVALEWCEAAARRARYAIDPAPFRRGLLAGVAAEPGSGVALTDTLNHAQMLALIANLRFPKVRVSQGGQGGNTGAARIDPSETVRFAGRDTVVVLGGVRFGLEVGRVATAESPEFMIRLGPATLPLGHRRAGGPFRSHDVVFDPLGGRILEVVETAPEPDADSPPVTRAPDR